jgi:hypothetical protein
MARPRLTTKVPEIYEDKPEGWKKAFLHALNKKNSEKASALFADAHFESFEDDANVPEDMKTLAAKLKQTQEDLEAAQAELAAKGTSGETT